MQDSHSIEDRIAQAYPALSGQLQAAADFVAGNRVDVATRSLRTLASSSGVSPATFSRLARALGYDDYETLREASRQDVSARQMSFAERAGRLQAEARCAGSADFLTRQAGACIQNITELATATDRTRLNALVDSLHRARKVLLVGSLGSAGIMEYFSYMAGWFAPDWMAAGRNGTTLGSSLSRMGKGDAVFVLSKAPYAARSVRAAELASAQGATVVVVTDSHVCPALRSADHSVIVPTESPQFFSSYTATLVLLEAIMGMLVALSGEAAQTRITRAETLVARLEGQEYE